MFAAVAAAIKARMVAQWASTPYAATDVFWQNEGNDVPDAAQFLFVDIVADDQELAGIGGGPGGNLYRHKGTIDIQVLVPLNGGVDAGFVLADAAAAIFRGQRFAGINVTVDCGTMPIQGGGAADNGRYFRVDAVGEFTADFTG